MPATAPPILLWLRLDLRLADHPALHEAVARAREAGAAVIPVYIWAPEEEGDWPPGAASRVWLHHSLAALAEALERRGSRLILRRGPSLATLRELARESGARTIHWSTRYEPALIARDEAVAAALRADGLQIRTFNSALLHDPQAIRTQGGGPFRVFTPFWKACLGQLQPPRPLPAPRAVPAPARWPAGLALGELGLLPAIDWAAGIRAAWRPGEAGARAELERFLHEGATGYPSERDRPDRVGTSRLSPHLHFGELSPAQCWHAGRDLESVGGGGPGSTAGVEAWLRELGWREFAHHLLVHYPATPTEPLRPEFAAFPWRPDARRLRAWQRGRTGYPLVDAALRELWAGGWMHNRMRMLAASFLVKDLLIPWQQGARWFWDTLVDADLASNTLGWQWTAGCGADAAPYFRVFNPVSQGAKFDPRGDYVRRWLPQLTGLEGGAIHAPWQATPLELAAAGVELGRGGNYPEPLVDHARARDAALAAFARIRRG